MGKNQMVKVMLMVAVLVGVLATGAFAATISVKQLGCGSEPDCSTTINGGYALAQDGDTIMVYPGTYNESLVIAKSIIFQGSGPQKTIIYGSTDAVTVKKYFSATIQGFTIRSASGNGIYVERDSDAIIKNNYIIGNAKKGIYSEMGCCYYGPASLSIINNVISYNAEQGIYAYASSKAGVINNIVSNNGGYGIAFYSSGGVNSYNNVYSNSSGNYSGTSAGTGEISQNPLFIDAVNGNYALQGTSPCKNAGSPGIADNDIDGTRNDLGAFGGPVAASFWPYPTGAPVITNLTANPTSVQKGGTITINATGEVW